MNLTKYFGLFALSFVFLSPRAALCQADANANAIALGSNVWTSGVKHDASLLWTTELEGDKQHGECKVKMEDTWMIALLIDADDGNLKGDLTLNHSEMPDGSSGLLCVGLAQAKFITASYRTVVAKDGSKLEAIFDKCQNGPCPNKAPISSPITFAGGGWSVTLPDGRVLKFEKFQPKNDATPK